METERFILDSSLGRLARYLRMMGYDAVYMKNAPARCVLKETLISNRYLLTRTHGLASRRDIDVYFVKSNDILNQISEVADELNLILTLKAMGRCLYCNVPLEIVRKEDVSIYLPPHVRRTQNSFSRCPVCRKIFWPGTHYARSIDRLIKALRKNRD